MTDRPQTRCLSPTSVEFKPSERPSHSTRQHFPDFGMQPMYNANITQTKLDQKNKSKKQLNLTASQAQELMRRFNELEVAHFDLQQKYGRQANKLEQCLFKLHQQTQLKTNIESQQSNLEDQIVQMQELCSLNEAKERKATAKMKRMQDAILKVGTLQEKSNENNQKQCDYITELLKQVDLLKNKLKSSEEARGILDTLCKEQEHQLLAHRKEFMMRDLEEEKTFNQEMAKRIAEMEQ